MKFILSYNSQLEWSHFIGYEEKNPCQTRAAARKRRTRHALVALVDLKSVELDDVA